MSQKVKRKLSHIEAHDECGNLVFFEMPYAAMYFDTKEVSNNDEERIRVKIEKLATEYCAKADKPDSAFDATVDLAGKEKFVNRLQDKGVWV